MDVQQTRCAECQAVWAGGKTCDDDFYQMLFWENEDPENGIVHHLMVLCFHLQHPSRYSQGGLAYALGLLVDFVEKGLPPQQVRRQAREEVNSKNREWKVTSRSSAPGAYRRPVRWSMVAADVVAAGPEHYIETVRLWAQKTLEDLRASGNT